MLAPYFPPKEIALFNKASKGKGINDMVYIIQYATLASCTVPKNSSNKVTRTYVSSKRYF